MQLSSLETSKFSHLYNQIISDILIFSTNKNKWVFFNEATFKNDEKHLLSTLFTEENFSKESLFSQLYSLDSPDIDLLCDINYDEIAKEFYFNYKDRAYNCKRSLLKEDDDILIIYNIQLITYIKNNVYSLSNKNIISLLDAVPIPLYISGEDNSLILMNNKMKDWADLTLYKGKHDLYNVVELMKLFISEHDLSRCLEKRSELLENIKANRSGAISLEVQTIDLHGILHVMLASSSNIVYHNKPIIITTLLDITEVRRQERELKVLNEMLTTTIDLMALTIKENTETIIEGNKLLTHTDN